jgi:hypothetical protein
MAFKILLLGKYLTQRRKGAETQRKKVALKLFIHGAEPLFMSSPVEDSHELTQITTNYWLFLFMVVSFCGDVKCLRNN